MTTEQIQELIASGQSLPADAPMADQLAWREALAGMRTGRSDLGDAPALVVPSQAAAPTLATPPAAAPRLSTADAFYAAANAAGQNPPAQDLPPAVAAMAPPQGAVAAPVAAPAALPDPIPAPPIPHGGDAGLPRAVAQPGTPAAIGALPPGVPMMSPAPAVGAHANLATNVTPAAPTFQAASARPAMPSFAGAQNLVPLRSYSPAPSMPGYGQARAGNSFMNPPTTSTAPGIMPMMPQTGGNVSAGIGGGSFVPVPGAAFSNGETGGLGSLFSPQPAINPQAIDPSLYGQFMTPQNFF